MIEIFEHGRTNSNEKNIKFNFDITKVNLERKLSIKYIDLRD